MKIKDLPKHLRPREKLIEKGPENLKDKELLAIILRTGNKTTNAIELSAEILRKYPMKKLLNLTYDQLLQIDGIDSGKACSLLAAFEITKRALDLYDNSRPKINSPQDVLDQLTNIRNLKKEHFVALYLSARNELIHTEIISIGTLNMSIVHPREVFQPAIQHNAGAIILAHNHPSGDIEPSDADEKITKRIIESGELLGIEVVDHLIVTKDGYRSII